MQRKTFADAECPIARSLERVGEWWSILIMRDALQGLRRFDEFSRSLDIAPNMLTRRLNALVEAGLLERQPYSQRPLRYQYVPTAKGEDFRVVLMAFVAWGNRHYAEEGQSVQLVERTSGRPVRSFMAARRWPNGTAGAMHRAGRACRQRGNAPAPGGHAGAERATGSMNGLPGVRRLVEETDEAFAVLFLVAGHRSRSWLGKTRSSRLAHGAGRSASRAVRPHREPSAC